MANKNNKFKGKNLKASNVKDVKLSIKNKNKFKNDKIKEKKKLIAKLIDEDEDKNEHLDDSIDDLDDDEIEFENETIKEFERNFQKKNSKDNAINKSKDEDKEMDSANEDDNEDNQEEEEEEEEENDDDDDENNTQDISESKTKSKNKKHSSFISIYNLHMLTTQKDLRELFKDCGHILKIFIKDGIRPDSRIKSAKIVFNSKFNVDKALKLNDTEFKGKKIRITSSVDQSKSINVSRSVFIGNLSMKVNESDLRKLFEECGQIENVKLIKAKKESYLNMSKSQKAKMNNLHISTNADKAYAFITFKTSDSRILACEKNKLQVNGRNIIVKLMNKKEKPIEKKGKSTFTGQRSSKVKAKNKKQIKAKQLIRNKRNISEIFSKK